MKTVIDIGHEYAGIKVEWDSEERLFRVTSHGWRDKERIVEFNDPDAAASEIDSQSRQLDLLHRLPYDEPSKLASWLWLEANDD